MDITIKKIGYKVGTCGWLASGLQSGTILINEGTLKDNGHHGLWLKATVDAKPVSQFLAAYDQYNVGDQHPASRQYDVAVGTTDRLTIWTDAAWNTLMHIAQDWCDACNAERESDEPLPLKAVRIA